MISPWSGAGWLERFWRCCWRVKDTRNLGLNYGTVQLFEAWGLAEVIHQQGFPIQHIEVSDRGHSGVVHIEAKEENLPFLGYGVPFNHLLAFLQNQVLACPEIQCIEGEVTHITVTETGAALQVGEQIFNASLLIGADGVESIVRQKMGWTLDEYDYQQTALIGPITMSQIQCDKAFERFTREGPIALLPNVPGQMTLVWVLPTHLAKVQQSLPNALFCQDLQKIFGYRAGIFQKIENLVAYPLKRATASQIYEGVVGLLGNAAHLLHPVAGQGFNLSVRDVLMFVEVIRRHRGQKLDASIWAEYAALSGSQQKQMSGVTHGFIKVFERTEWPVKALRNVMLHGLEVIRPARKILNDVMIGRM
ncbi:MAG: FAD-dependent monooxygenase [Gammaproteobacteria bacterium]|nr:FAD-dependent monooxygenase [Gammaproteobacteria bacterium]